MMVGKSLSCRLEILFEKNCPGTDVMIIFSPKNLVKKLAFLTENKANLKKNRRKL
jgi:hypothetical protein